MGSDRRADQATRKMNLWRNFILAMAVVAVTLPACAPIPTYRRSGASYYRSNSLQRQRKSNRNQSAREKFRHMDSNGNGQITMDEWMTFVIGMGMRVNEQALRREVNSMNTDGNCCLDFNEMLPHLTKQYNMSTQLSAARLFDKDNNGFISVNELKYFMAKVYPNKYFTNQQAGQVIRAWDSNDDGRLSTNELATNSHNMNGR